MSECLLKQSPLSDIRMVPLQVGTRVDVVVSDLGSAYWYGLCATQFWLVMAKTVMVLNNQHLDQGVCSICKGYWNHQW